MLPSHVVLPSHMVLPSHAVWRWSEYSPQESVVIKGLLPRVGDSSTSERWVLMAGLRWSGEFAPKDVMIAALCHN